MDHQAHAILRAMRYVGGSFKVRFVSSNPNGDSRTDGEPGASVQGASHPPMLFNWEGISTRNHRLPWRKRKGVPSAMALMDYNFSDSAFLVLHPVHSSQTKLSANITSPQ